MDAVWSSTPWTMQPEPEVVTFVPVMHNKPRNALVGAAVSVGDADSVGAGVVTRVGRGLVVGA